MKPFLIPILLILSWGTRAREIEVRALFGGAAVLVIDGHRQILKQGDEKFGILSVSADT